MPCSVADRIGFGLHDAAAGSLPAKIVHQHFADQEAGKLDGVAGQVTAAKPPDRRGAMLSAHKLQNSTIAVTIVLRQA